MTAADLYSAWDELSAYSSIEYIGEYRGSHIYMKRDDKIPFSYGGNKVRIAAELMKDMEDGGYTAVISYGSESSNMNRAVADMAKLHGIKCYCIIKKEAQAADKSEEPASGKGDDSHTRQAQWEQEFLHAGRLKFASASGCNAEGRASEKSSGYMHENERLARAAGAEIIYCTDGNVRECVEVAISKAKADGFKPYYIYGDSTGSGNEVSLMRASYNEYAEIKSYERESGVCFDAIVLTAGTGMTIAGYAAAVNDELAGEYNASDKYAAAKRRAESEFAKACIADKVNADLNTSKSEGEKSNSVNLKAIIGISSARNEENSLSHIRAALLKWYDGDESRIKLMPEIKDAYLCGGYGRYNEEIEETIRCMEDKGIALDPTYTGKSYWGMLREIDRGSIRGNILFIHTGGYPVYTDWKKLCINMQTRRNP